MSFFLLGTYYFIPVLTSVPIVYRNRLQVQTQSRKFWLQVPRQQHKGRVARIWCGDDWTESPGGQKLRKDSSWLCRRYFPCFYTKEQFSEIVSSQVYVHASFKPCDVDPQGIPVSSFHVNSKMTPQVRKSHGRPSTDAHRTGARLLSPQMEMTKASHTIQPDFWTMQPPPLRKVH